MIDRVYHIDRGYERIEEKLRSVGARHRARHQLQRSIVRDRFRSNEKRRRWIASLSFQIA